MIHSNNSISQLGRRFGGALLSLLLCCTMQAQEQIRIWQGGNTSSSRFTTSELLFSEDGTNLSINDTTFQTSEIDSIMVVHTVTVTYNGAQATVDLGHAPGVTYTTDGAHVNIVSTNTKDELEFVLQGESTQGSLTYTGSLKCKFYLNGLKLTSNKGAAIGADGGVIDIQCGKRVDLILNDGTENILVDAPNGQQKAALYCKGHVELSGGGSLTVTGKSKHGIATNEYLELKEGTGNITVNGAVSDAMHIEQYFLMKGGTLNLSGMGGDGLQVETKTQTNPNTGLEEDDPTKENNGMMFIQGGSIQSTVTGSCTEGIKVPYNLYFSGGTIGLKDIANGKEKYIPGILASGLGSKGISVGGDMVVSEEHNTTLIVINATGTDYEDPETDETKRCMGIKVDNNMTVNAGTIRVYNTGVGTRGIRVKGIYTNNGGDVKGSIYTQ